MSSSKTLSSFLQDSFVEKDFSPCLSRKLRSFKVKLLSLARAKKLVSIKSYLRRKRSKMYISQKVLFCRQVANEGRDSMTK